MDEQHAITLCLKHRDPAGFEFLVSMFRRQAYVHAHALLGNAADATDACQECFTKAFHAMPGLARLDRFYPWFYRILRNHCLNAIARRRVREAYQNSHEPDASPGPAFLVTSQDDQRLVRDALEALRPVYREILMLKYFDDMSYDAIASHLGIPRGTVMSRLYHARHGFRLEYMRRTDSGGTRK